MATTPAGMHAYFDVVTICAVLIAIATTVLFRERPAVPPSASAAAAWAEEDARQQESSGFSLTALTYPAKARALLQSRGFVYATAAFVASIGCTNVVSTFTAPELARAGFAAESFSIDLAGAAFQIAIVLGGIGLGSYVDATKQFKPVILGCFGVAIAVLAGLGVSEGYSTSFAPSLVVGLLLSLGASAGPVQPIAAELAVEVSYPCDENAVEATQQLSGNLFSALLVPLCESAAAYDLKLGDVPDVRGDTLVLLGMLVVTGVFFTSFDAPLERTLLDEAE